MKCNCITEVTEKIKQDLQENPRYKKPVKKIEIIGVGFSLSNAGGVESRLFNPIEVELEGQKKRERLSLFHSYCPFCGKPATDNESTDNEK